MQSLYYELRIIIFKYVDTPISLILTDRKWYAITQDPYARAEWLIYKYGKTHALFHAVRLGSDFITVGLVRILLVRNAIISRYFIQRLLMSIGSEGKKLIEIRNRSGLELNIKLPYDINYEYNRPEVNNNQIMTN